MSFKGTCYGKENWGHRKLLLIGLEWLALRVKKVAWKFGSFYSYWVMFVFWACITFFVPPWNGHCPNEGLCPYSPLGSYFYDSSFFPWACWPYWPTGLIISFLWAFSAHLFYFYLLFFLWACWLSFLPCWSIGLATSFLGLPRPTYFIFTSYSFHGLASCHSGHVGPLGLLTCFYHSYFLFPSTSLIVGLLLSLGLSSKVGINTHINL